MSVDAPVQTRPRTVPTLNSLSAGQVEAIRRINSFNETVTNSIDASRSASIFLDPRRYDLEQDMVFKRFPVPVTASAAVAEPGSVVPIDSYGSSIIIARAKDGVVRAFLNACTHKGAQLVEGTDPRPAGRLVCPYHAWTFGLDGTLIGVPRLETFKGLCKADRPLVQLECRELGGLIWVGLDRHRVYDFSTVDAKLIDDFEAMNLSKLHLYGRRLFDLKANWKLVLEPFLESYHVQRLHAKSVGPLFADVSSVTDCLGHHIRQISGKVGYTPADLDREGENIHKSVTHSYQVFPNTVVITSPYYISVMILAPRGVDRTVVDYMMLTREAPDNPKAEELFERSFVMVQEVFGGEDFHAAEISQLGLSSGALSDVRYCGMEETIPLYYDTLESYLEA